jgi:hypothetical protein
VTTREDFKEGTGSGHGSSGGNGSEPEWGGGAGHGAYGMYKDGNAWGGGDGGYSCGDGGQGPPPPGLYLDGDVEVP